jgi:hypothetical protein
MGTSSRFSTKREAIAVIVMIDGCMDDSVVWLRGVGSI